ncbi:MAG TPA: protein phosphatase 2C domain-containing protein [Pyrinomonadaceae bacterium]|nr:protein phosphatase 2C domain-containing protein [Pyrinomonadaceae bacterium]
MNTTPTDSGERGGERHRLPSPISSNVDVDVFALSHQGHIRKLNEDHYLVVHCGRYLETDFSNVPDNLPGYRFDETAFGLLVADGVGGRASGEVASREALINLLDLALRTPDWQFRWGQEQKDTVAWRMQDRFRRVNSALLEQGYDNANLDGMCTTLTAAMSHGKDLVIGHVGDSRAYLLRRGELQRLTSDHTLAEQLLDEGQDIKNDNLLKTLGNVLVQAVGGSYVDFRPDVLHFTLADRDQLLLCTDGLTEMVDDVLIASILEDSDSAQSACRKLVELALAGGGHDNVTVVVARYSIREPS